MKGLLRRLSRVADSSAQYKPLQKPHPSAAKPLPLVPGRQRRGRVPEGHVPVDVGDGPVPERFAVPAELLSSPAFADLLRRAGEEYGFEQRGVLRLPCAVEVFRAVAVDAAGDDFSVA